MGSEMCIRDSSDPDLEWKESLNKGRAIFKAVEMVQEKLKG